jgi:hypothetical protein
MIHAQIHRKDLYMVQIDFSDAFVSVPHDLILSNMTAMGIPTTVTELVRNIYAEEDPVQMGMEMDLDELTAIETHQASVQARDAAMMDGRPIPEIEEHPDGHKDPERLKAAQRDLDRLQTMRRAVRAHETFAAVDSLGEYKKTRVLRRSPSAEIVISN